MPRAWPSVRVIVGRVVWKSKNSSGSIWASSSASSDSATAARAREEELAASFQPRKEQISIGERSCGTSLSQIRESTLSRLPRASPRARDFSGWGDEGAAEEAVGEEE